MLILMLVQLLRLIPLLIQLLMQHHITYSNIETNAHTIKTQTQSDINTSTDTDAKTKTNVNISANTKLKSKSSIKIDTDININIMTKIGPCLQRCKGATAPRPHRLGCTHWFSNLLSRGKWKPKLREAPDRSPGPIRLVPDFASC